MEHLPPTFTWQDYLDWAEKTAPDATYDEVRGLFDLFASKGLIVPNHINEKNEFVYELKPDGRKVRVVTAIVMKGPMARIDYKPERDE